MSGAISPKRRFVNVRFVGGFEDLAQAEAAQ